MWNETYKRRLRMPCEMSDLSGYTSVLGGKGSQFYPIRFCIDVVSNHLKYRNSDLKETLE